MKFKYRKHIYIGTFSVMLLGMMFFSTTGKSREEKDPSSLSETKISTESAVAVGEQEKKGAVSTGLLMKDAYPEVNQLIRNFFDAKLKVDEKALALYVDKTEYLGLKTLSKMVKEIEGIEDIVCYTLDGPEKDSYIVYVYNEVKFKGIATKSTSLDGFYVKKGEDGNLRIILSPIPEEIQKIIDEDSKREDVSALISDVNTKLTKEIKSDKDLAALLLRLKESAQKKEEKKAGKGKKEQKNN